MNSKQTSLCWRFFFLVPVFFLASLFGMPGRGLAGVNLEVPIEMIDRGISSPTSTTDFARSEVLLDKANYDGDTVDYYFEIVAKNTDDANRYVSLIDKSNGNTVKASQLVPTGTTDRTRFRLALSDYPVAGNNRYRIRLDGTTTAETLKVFAARIVIVQTDATQTRIQIPLLNHGFAGMSQATGAGTDNTSATGWSQGEAARFTIWKRDTSVWGDIASGNPWTFEAVVKANNGGTASACLYNITAGHEVDDSIVSTTSASFVLLSQDLASDAAYFDTDNHEFEVKHKISNALYQCRVARACLYVKLINLYKGEVYWRYTRKISTSSSNWHGAQRVQLNTDNYSNPKVYHESTGTESAPGDISSMVAGAEDNDVENTGTMFAITDSEIVFDSSRTRKRTTTDLMLNPWWTSGHRYIHHIGWTSGTIVISSGWLVVEFFAVVGATHYVDQDGTYDAAGGTCNGSDSCGTSIQAAVNSAGPGDTVRVCPGTYVEDVVVDESHLTLKSESGPDSTHIVGQVKFDASVQDLTGCRLEGFDIHGKDTWYGLVYLYAVDSYEITDTTIKDCYIHDNPNDLYGAGIVLRGRVAPTIIGNAIHNNGPMDFYWGGGIKSWGSDLRGNSAENPIIIRGNTIYANGGSGISLRCDESGAPEVKVTIGGSAAEDANDIYGHQWKLCTGIELDWTKEAIIRNNQVHHNNFAGISMKAAKTAVIKSNHIYENGSAGIRYSPTTDFNFGLDQVITIGGGNEADGNDIFNNYAGISFHVNSDSEYCANLAGSDIRKNYIHNNTRGGIAIGRGAGAGQAQMRFEGQLSIGQNNISQNGWGGIGIHTQCELMIFANDVHHSTARGGIHTGDDWGRFYKRFNGTYPVFTIKQNKVHDNYLGGIDVRHASDSDTCVIRNNLLHGNSRAGLRFGPGVDQVINNTVADNGDRDRDIGGAIVFDDPDTCHESCPKEGDDCAADCEPDGVPPASVLIRNNICAFNQKAGIRACFDNTGRDRDHNLLYSNSQDFLSAWCASCASPDCSQSITTLRKRCRGAQLGRCLDDFSFCCNQPGATGPVAGETLLFDDPMFIPINFNPYHISSYSPAKNMGDDGWDLGCYGGPVTESMNDNLFLQPPAIVHCLKDGDTGTGNSPEGGTYILFEMGGWFAVDQVRLYGSPWYRTYWDVSVGDNITGCQGAWGTEVVTDWPVGGYGLLDGDTSTGNSPEGGRWSYFYLGGDYTVRHVRLYGTNTYPARTWEVRVGSDSYNCTSGSWGEGGGTWSVGGGSGPAWYEHTLSSPITGSYIGLYSTGSVNEYEVFEFEFTDAVSPGNWLTPQEVVGPMVCTDITTPATWYETAVSAECAYIKLNTSDDEDIRKDSVFEFQWTDPAYPGDWFTPYSTVSDCTDIFGQCAELP